MWLRLIGPPGLFDTSGQLNRLATRKQIALLVYLNFNSSGHGVRRDEVIELLWPTLTSAKGSQSLSQGLSEIRNKLGRNAVTRGGSYVSLTKTLPTDVTHLEHLELNHSRGATALEGMEDVSGVDFAHWVEASREAITKDLRKRLNADLDKLRTCGNHSAVRERAAQLYGIDPENVRAISILAETAAQHGDKENAISLITDVMASKDEWDPVELSHLRRLKARIQSSTHVQVCAQELQPNTLIGRHDELQRMHSAVVRSPQQTPTAILVTGPPGLGKSALAYRFLNNLEADGEFCLRINGTNNLDTNAFTRGCVKVLAQSPELGSTDPEYLAELSRVTPSLRKAYPGIPRVDATVQSLSTSSLANALVHTIATVVSQPRVTVCIEDIDKIDVASLALLQTLLAERLPFRLTVIATCSSDYQAVSPRDHHYIHTIPWTDVLPLKPLAPQECRDIIRRMGPGDPHQISDTTVERLVGWCKGSPFLIQVALADLAINGGHSLALSYTSEDVGYRWEPAPHIRAQLEGRFGGFWFVATDLVDVLAVSVRPLTIETLHRITTCSEEGIRTAVQVGMDMGLLESVAEGFIFPEGVLKAYATSRMSQSRWEFCHRIIAEELKEPLLAIEHLRAVGDTLATLQLTHRVALRYIETGKYRLAENILRKLLQSSSEQRDTTQLLLARVLAVRGRHEEARGLVCQLDATRLTDSERATKNYLLAEANINLVHAPSERSAQHTETWATTLETQHINSDDNTLLLAGETAAVHRDWSKIRLITQKSRDHAHSTKPGNYLVSLAFCQMAQGLYDQAIRNFQRGAVLMAHNKRILQQARSFNGIGACAFALGRFSTAVEAFKYGYELASQVGNTTFAAAIASNLAAVYTDYDFPRKAAWWLDRSSPALHNQHRRCKYRFSVLANYADLAITHGEPNKIADAVQNEIDTRQEQITFDTYVRCARADLLLSIGDWHGALEEVARAEVHYPYLTQNKVPRFMPGFDSPHLARLVYLKAWRTGQHQLTRRLAHAWPTGAMSVAQRAELLAVFAWCAEQDDPRDRAKTAEGFYRRAGELVRQSGLTGVIRRLNSLGILGKRLQPLAG